jgi:hypothetical protein
MPKERTAIEAAAGKLISAVQREWGAEAGTPEEKLSEQVLYRAHDLLQSAKADSLCAKLGSHGVADYLGASWVGQHLSVMPMIKELESLLSRVPHV